MLDVSFDFSIEVGFEGAVDLVKNGVDSWADVIKSEVGFFFNMPF